MSRYFWNAPRQLVLSQAKIGELGGITHSRCESTGKTRVTRIQTRKSALGPALTADL